MSQFNKNTVLVFSFLQTKFHPHAKRGNSNKVSFIDGAAFVWIDQNTSYFVGMFIV